MMLGAFAGLGAWAGIAIWRSRDLWLTKPERFDGHGLFKQVAPLIKNLRSVLHRQLDRLMLNFKKSNPEFYAGYLSARVIVDRGNPAKKKTTTPAKPQ